MNKVFHSIIIVALNYILLFILSLIVMARVDTGFMGAWGLLSAFIMFILAIPLDRFTYFGGRAISGAMTPKLLSDEHLHKKQAGYYKNESEKNQRFQETILLSGVITLITSFYLI
jgi:hypothetical protein